MYPRSLMLLLCFAPIWACRHQANIKKAQPSVWEQAQAQQREKWLGQDFSHLKFKDIDGNWLGIADFRGTVVLLNFWFQACAPCLTELPSLRRLQDRYASKGFKIISLSLDEAEKLRRFAEKEALPFLLIPSAKSLAEHLGLHQYPGNFLLDSKGRVVDVSLGASDWDATYTYFMLKPSIDRLLEGG